MNLSNYRPIFLLPYLAKILGAHVARHLSIFIEQSEFLEPHQAGFRPAHSTEAVILTVLDRLRSHADTGFSQALVLLDLSAAFDTVNHDILLDRVRQAGIQGPAYKWIKSFLEGRTQAVRLDSFTSSNSIITCGVPQGSSLSPLLFNLYIQPLICSLKKRKATVFNYADDLQIIFTLDSSQASSDKFQSTMLYIQHWMDCNHLKLNPGKTELILPGKSEIHWGPHFWPTKLGPPPHPNPLSEKSWSDDRCQPLA